MAEIMGGSLTGATVSKNVFVAERPVVSITVRVITPVPNRLGDGRMVRLWPKSPKMERFVFATKAVFNDTAVTASKLGGSSQSSTRNDSDKRPSSSMN